MENVNHPQHYKAGRYECIDVMADVFGKAETAAFCKLNAFKYLWRADAKGGVEDVRKAAWYLDKYAELMDEEAETVDHIPLGMALESPVWMRMDPREKVDVRMTYADLMCIYRHLSYEEVNSAENGSGKSYM